MHNKSGRENLHLSKADHDGRLIGCKEIGSGGPKG